MSWTMYEGDGQEIKVPNTFANMPGEFMLETVRYIGKRHGADRWVGILGNGAIVEQLQPVRDKLRRVGCCSFGYDFIKLLRSEESPERAAAITQHMKGRKRKL